MALVLHCDTVLLDEFQLPYPFEDRHDAKKTIEEINVCEHLLFLRLFGLDQVP